MANPISISATERLFDSDCWKCVSFLISLTAGPAKYRKLYPRSMQSDAMLPIFPTSQDFRPKLGLASVILWQKRKCPLFSRETFCYTLLIKTF